MTLLSESEAAKATGLTRFAIRRHLKNGQLSANNGLIDNSELIRVFGPQLSDAEPVYGPSRHPESALLKYKLNEIENTLANERLLLEEVRQDRDFWCRQAGLEGRRADKLTDIIGHQEQNVRMLASHPRRQPLNLLNLIDLSSIVGAGLVAAGVIWFLSRI